MKRRIFVRISIIVLIAGLIVYYFFPEKALSKDVTVDRIELHKSERELMIFANGKLLKIYPVSLGFNPVGDKQFRGDGKTPLGKYIIHAKNPRSDYYLNLGISYPNEKDKREAQMLNKPPGGAIKIHGLPDGYGFIGKFHRWIDWTAGCIAVTNSEMEELYLSVPLGTEIRIYE